MSANEPTPEELLGHVDWVRGLAKSLVGDASLAEDIAQETWLAASQARPAGVGNVKAWLAGIARNRARMAGRSRSRRRSREAAAARPEALESTAELAERASLQKDLLGRVLELEEPLRAVVLLRFFDELKPPAIATRLGLPLKTVHSRLARALERLRVRLDGEYGDRRSWALAFVPLMRTPAGATAALSLPLIPLAAGALMNTKALVAASVAAVLLCGYGLIGLLDSDPGGEAAHPEEQGAQLERGGETVAPALAGAPVPERAGVAVKEASAALAEAAEMIVETPAAVVVGGRVLTFEGEPVVGVELVRAGQLDEVLATSGSGGTFEIELSGSESLRARLDSRGEFLRVRDPEWATLRASAPAEASPADGELVVVAPAESLRASIVDAEGTPIEGADLSINSYMGGMHAFPYRFEQTSGVEYSGRSNAFGAVELEGVPGCPGMTVSIGAEGYVPVWTGLDDRPQPYVFELTRLEDVEGVQVQGIVLDPSGFPVEDALVRFWNDETRSGSDGLFSLNLERMHEGLPLCAIAVGHQPALIADFSVWFEEQGPGPIELMLGPDPVGLSGRVVTDAGEPLEGWQVHLLDETALSKWSIPVLTAEGLTRELSREASLLGRFRGSREVLTDDEGRFALDGFYPREYRVRVVDPETLVMQDAVLLAGSGEQRIEVHVELRGPVGGRVVDRNGNALEGVELVLGQRTFETTYGSTSIEGAQAVSDAEGRFELGMAPLGGGFVGYSGEAIMFGRIELDGRAELGALEVVVSTRMHFRIELGEPESADSFQLLDEDLNNVQINSIQAHGMSAFTRGDLLEGRSQTLSVADTAVWIVLSKAGEEVARERLVFGSEEVTTLRL